MTNCVFLIASFALVVYSNTVIKARGLVHTGRCADPGIVGYLVSMLFNPLVWMRIGATGAAALPWLLSLRKIDLGIASPG
jgi:hypothetical protein